MRDDTEQAAAQDGVLDDPQELAEAVGKAMYDVDNATQGLHIRLESIAPGEARMSMRVRAGHGSTPR